MLDSKGGHRQQGGRKGGCSRGASSVIFNTSGAAKKTDKDKQNDGRGGDKQKQGDQVLRKGEGGAGWSSKAIL